jgi:ribonuclease P protein component
MLAKALRAGREEVERTIRDGRTVSAGLVYAKILKRESGAHFAVIVSKKVAKTSVARHALKRKISAVLEKRATALKKFSGIMVFFANKSPKQATFKELAAAVEEVLTKAGVIV